MKNKPDGFADNKDNEGVTGITLTQVSGQINIANGKTGTAGAWCPAGSTVVGGGFNQTFDNLRITNSSPYRYGGTHGWVVGARNMGDTSTETVGLVALALCLSVDPPDAITIAKKGALPASVKKALKKRGR